MGTVFVEMSSLLKFKIFVIKIPRWSKILSSSLYDMLKLSKTTSPPKLSFYDCITLNFEDPRCKQDMLEAYFESMNTLPCKTHFYRTINIGNDYL